jgi:hypothetical protein
MPGGPDGPAKLVHGKTLTVLCNYNHGAFQSGDKLDSKQEFLRFLKRCFEEWSEEIAADRRRFPYRSGVAD